jgi:hypothetical protein
VLTHAREVVARTVDLARYAQQLRSGRGGSLRVGMIDAAAVDHFSPALRQFRAERPELDLRLTVTNSTELLDLLGRAELDLVVCVEPPGYIESLVVTPLTSEPLLVHAPDPGDLDRPPGEWGPWVTFPSGSHTRTGGEILEQWATLEAPVPDLFVAGVGTGGTLTGVGRRLREAYPEIRIVSVVPELFPGIEGLKPLGHPGDIVPEILDQSLIDERIPVSIEQALATCHALVRQGLFVGPSSGAYVHAARNLAARGTHRCIVTVLSDTGERYNSTGMWRQR